MGIVDRNVITENIISNNDLYGLIIVYSTGNHITNNNFINNKYQAYFNIQLSRCFSNKWNQNYWSDITFPEDSKKVIQGIAYFVICFTLILWYNVDWHPAQEPYDIGV